MKGAGEGCAQDLEMGWGGGTLLPAPALTHLGLTAGTVMRLAWAAEVQRTHSLQLGYTRPPRRQASEVLGVKGLEDMRVFSEDL